MNEEEKIEYRHDTLSELGRCIENLVESLDNLDFNRRNRYKAQFEQVDAKIRDMITDLDDGSYKKEFEQLRNGCRKWLSLFDLLDVVER